MSGAPSQFPRELRPSLMELTRRSDGRAIGAQSATWSVRSVTLLSLGLLGCGSTGEANPTEPSRLSLIQVERAVPVLAAEPALAALTQPSAPTAVLADAELQEHELPNPELLTSCDQPRMILVRKAARTLELRCGTRLVVRFAASLGFAPEGHKQREGDGRTPEGDYFISKKFPSGFHRSLQIAYPNIADADAGMATGTITRQEHRAIVHAQQQCKEPPQTTGLGSLLQLHGGGGGTEAGDWTLGCVAVDNERIEQVYAFQTSGCDERGVPHTLVRIVP